MNLHINDRFEFVRKDRIYIVQHMGDKRSGNN